MRTAFKRSGRLVAALCAVVLIAGCGGQETSSGGPDSLQGTDPDLARFYEQEVSWGDCEETSGDTGLECADLEVPADYDQPDGETTTVVMARSASTSDAAGGSLILNPGGPGGSGVDLMQVAPGYFDSSIQERYDLVSFDPRGVFRSDGIDCLDAEGLDRWRAESAYDPAAESLDELRSSYQEVGEACAENSGPVLEHMDTDSVARDLDVMRAVLGDARINYVGFSYGTQIGAAYAELFPDRVGRFVLDGAVDPSLSNAEITLGQAESFEASLRQFIQECTETNAECFTDGTVDDGLAEVQRIIARTQDETITARDGRQISAVSAVEGVLVPLYNPAAYSTLNEALVDAQGGDYTALMGISDTNHGRQSDGTYRGNSSVAFAAVNCLDYDSRNVTDEQMAADQEALEQVSPTFGQFLGYTDAACQGWPFGPSGSPHAAQYTGDSEVLVVGTRHDPATPYPWAEALTEQLGNARLLTYEGWGHGAYTSGNACVVSAVDAYLVDGELPPEGEVCGR